MNPKAKGSLKGVKTKPLTLANILWLQLNIIFLRSGQLNQRIYYQPSTLVCVYIYKLTHNLTNDAELDIFHLNLWHFKEIQVPYESFLRLLGYILNKNFFFKVWYIFDSSISFLHRDNLDSKEFKYKAFCLYQTTNLWEQKIDQILQYRV